MQLSIIENVYLRRDHADAIANIQLDVINDIREGKEIFEAVSEISNSQDKLFEIGSAINSVESSLDREARALLTLMTNMMGIAARTLFKKNPYCHRLDTETIITLAIKKILIPKMIFCMRAISEVFPKYLQNLAAIRCSGNSVLLSRIPLQVESLLRDQLTTLSPDASYEDTENVLLNFITRVNYKLCEKSI